MLNQAVTLREGHGGADSSLLFLELVTHLSQDDKTNVRLRGHYGDKTFKMFVPLAELREAVDRLEALDCLARA